MRGSHKSDVGCICTCARARLFRTMVPPHPLVHRRSRRHTGTIQFVKFQWSFHVHFVLRCFKRLDRLNYTDWPSEVAKQTIQPPSRDSRYRADNTVQQMDKGPRLHHPRNRHESTEQNRHESTEQNSLPSQCPVWYCLQTETKGGKCSQLTQHSTDEATNSWLSLKMNTARGEIQSPHRETWVDVCVLAKAITNRTLAHSPVLFDIQSNLKPVSLKLHHAEQT